MIYRIMYMSRAIRALSEDDVERLAERASDRNAALSITGLLLFDGRRFLQAIEGDREAVGALMDRIRQDDRHDMIETMTDGPGDQRMFGSWSLAYKRVGEECCTKGYLHKVKQRMATVSDIELQSAFIGFAKLAYDAEPRRLKVFS